MSIWYDYPKSRRGFVVLEFDRRKDGVYLAIPIADRRQYLVQKVLVGSILFAVLLGSVWLAPLIAWQIGWACIGIAMLGELTYQALRARHRSGWWLVLGVQAVVIAGGTTTLMFLRLHPLGSEWVFTIAAVVIATDVGGQLFGDAFGVKGTFFPVLSPHKSLAGACGGVLLALLVGFLSSLLLLTQYSQVQSIGLLLLPLIAIAGDLLASCVKRVLGIKDFSSLLGKSTGGVLDRFDSWMLAFMSVGTALFFMSM